MTRSKLAAVILKTKYKTLKRIMGGERVWIMTSKIEKYLTQTSRNKVTKTIMIR